MADSDRYAYYLRDLGYLLKERALDAKRQSDASPDEPYAMGKSMAYFEVISLMQNQAISFEIALEDICLSDVGPERDII